MALKVKTGIPDNIQIGDAYTLRFAATDPVTGADVTGVVVSKVSVLAEVVSDALGAAQLGRFRLVPGPGA